MHKVCQHFLHYIFAKFILHNSTVLLDLLKQTTIVFVIWIQLIFPGGELVENPNPWFVFIEFREKSSFR